MSRSGICKWFRTAFPFKGSMWKLNKVPMDKFTDNNFLCWAEFMWRVKQIPTCRLVFGDEKPLKGDELLFTRWGRADPLTGIVEDIVIDFDWQNTYTITGLCRIGRDRPPCARRFKHR